MGPKKKLTRAERNRLEMERLEQARIQAELETQRAIEEERKRLELEMKLALEKEKKETSEQALRIEQLTNSISLIKSILDYSWNLNRKEKDEFEWEQYMNCTGLPDPTKPSQMTTYLHLWKENCTEVSVDQARHKTAEIITLLQLLEEFIDDPFDSSTSQIRNWKWIRALCREQQEENLNMATYHRLRDINVRLNRPDIPTANFDIIDENFILCLWLLVELAKPLHNPRGPARKRLEINFPQTRLDILFPSVLDPTAIVIRAIYVKYDHFSDNCLTYDKPGILPEIDRDLLEATTKEWYIKMKYKWDNRKGSLTGEDLKRDGIPPAVPYRKLEPTPSQHAIDLEENPVEVPAESETPSTPKISASKLQDEEGPGTEQIGDPSEAQLHFEEPPARVHDKKKKKKQYAHLLSEDSIKFKSVSFETALTPEEKAAKKAARLAKKKGKKGGKQKKKAEEEPKPLEVVVSAEATPTQEETEEKVDKPEASKEEVVPVPEDKVKEKKDKKKKKGKKGKDKAPSDESPEKKEGDGEQTEDEDKPEVEGAHKKKKKKKEKSTESADETGSPKKGKKSGGKKKSKTKLTDKSTTSESELDQPIDKKGTKKKHKKQKGAVTLDYPIGDADSDESHASETKRKRKRAKKTVSWISPHERKLMGRSTSGLITKKSSSELKSRGEYEGVDSTMSIQSYGSDSGSKMNLESSSSLKATRTRSKAKSKTKRRKSKSWGSLDEAGEIAGDEEERLGKKRKKEKKHGKVKKPVSKEIVAEAPIEEKKVKKEKAEKPEVVPEVKAKGKGKKKKGKKEAEPAPVEEVDDIMAQIQKMKAQAAVQAMGPAADEAVKEEEKPKKKGKKGKKGKKKQGTGDGEPRKRRLSQGEQIRQDMEKAEQVRLQAELDEKRAEEEERRRQEEERRLGREKEKREAAEQQLRVEQLAHSLNLVRNMLEANWNTNTQEKIDLEWAQYLKCDGLPDPTKPAEMNTYLHLWEQALEDVSVEEVTHRTDEITALLEVLQDFIDDPFDASDSLKSDWKWVRSLCREHQQENLDMATYRLLRDIDSRLNRLDIPTADYHIDQENFNLSLWLYVQLATPMYNPRAPIKKRLEIDFPKMGLNVLFPSDLETKCMAIRTTYVRYDHLSDTCATYERPAIHPQIDKDLCEMTANEWFKKMWYKWEHKKPPPKKMIEDAEGNMIEVEEPEPEIPADELPPTVPWQKLEPTPSTVVIDKETELYEKVRKRLFIELPEKVINLRKFLIIGGIYSINLFYQPPQPHDQVAFDIRITALQIPKRLYEVPFYIPLQESTKSSSALTPEDLEEAAKKQEAELDRLMLVTLTLPDHVMFLDLPTVCHWDQEHKYWTTEDVYDLKHIEEKNYMTFRTGRFGPFSLAVNRYINFPFQAWELKPEVDGSVTFQLTCAILMVEFNIKDNRICLTQLQNSPNNALQDIVGTYFKLPKLIRVLQTGGIDLFPACDAFCYIEGTCEKHWPTERHLYYNMALLSPSYNFAWSRWNNQAGRRNIVVQMREYKLNSAKQRNHSMLLVTPLKSTFIETTEVSPTFNDTPAEGMKFYSDLYNLMKGTSTMATRNKVQTGSPDVAKTLSDLLIMTRVVSFS